MPMKTHPRLYLDAQALNRIALVPTLPYLKRAAALVKKDAARFVKLPPIQYDPTGHNAHLVRARHMQTRVVTLLARWQQTGRDKYRAAVLEHVRMMHDWEYWSWLAWRQQDPSPSAIFDLSYGENSATLALAYDWLHSTLSAKEKKLFLDTARKWSFASARKNIGKGKSWWFGKADCNWNTVCAGGIGMLALAMYEDLPLAPKVLALAEQSIKPFMRLLDQTRGGWPEGLGYWNYGMRYAFMYLLSHVHATGETHPLLKLKGVRETLSFPLDFCPHGEACSFGDVGRWQPLPFHYAVAKRLGEEGVCAALDDRLAEIDFSAGDWPNAAEWLALHPGEAAQAKPRAGKPRRVKLYQGLGWGIIADRMPKPNLYMAVRGGTTEVPHSHLDLLSFHCVIGGERLIVNLAPAEYLDTTFSPRRHDLFEIRAESKNTILINGVGIANPSTLDHIGVIRTAGAEGLRLEATSAMGKMRDGPAVRFCGRVILLLQDRAFLIVDHVDLPYAGRMESRLHTFAEVKARRSGAVLAGKRQKLRLAYASNVPAVLLTARTSPTTPSAPGATSLRWCAEKLHQSMTLATLLAPGAASVKVSLAEEKSKLVITVSGRGWSAEVKLTKKLRLAK